MDGVQLAPASLRLVRPVEFVVLSPFKLNERQENTNNVTSSTFPPVRAERGDALLLTGRISTNGGGAHCLRLGRDCVASGASRSSKWRRNDHGAAKSAADDTRWDTG